MPEFPPIYKPAAFALAMSMISIIALAFPPTTQASPEKNKGPSERGKLSNGKGSGKTENFVPDPMSLRLLTTTDRATNQKIRQIVESSDWMALQRQIREIAFKNQVPLPPRVRPGGRNALGPPGARQRPGPENMPPGLGPGGSQTKAEKIGGDLLAAMSGADAPNDSNE